MAPRLWTLLTLPTNSSSSFASSTTSDGCSAHRARNWELSTLPGEDTAGPRPPPGPRPWPLMQNQSQEERGKASEQVQVQMLSAPKGTHGPLGRKLGLVNGVGTGLCGSGLQKGAQMVWKAPWRGTGASTGDYRSGRGGTEAGAFWTGESSVGSSWPQVMLGSRAQAAEGAGKGLSAGEVGTPSRGRLSWGQ